MKSSNILFKAFLPIALAGFHATATAGNDYAPIDCSRAYAPSVESAMKKQGVAFKVEDRAYLMERLSMFSATPKPWPKGRLGTAMDQAATLYRRGDMISAGIVYAQAGLGQDPLGVHLGEQLRAVYEPFEITPGHDGHEHDSEELELARDLKAFKQKLADVRMALPVYAEAPVRWYFQGLVYHDPMAVEVASHLICTDKRLTSKLAAIDREARKID